MSKYGHYHHLIPATAAGPVPRFLDVLHVLVTSNPLSMCLGGGSVELDVNSDIEGRLALSLLLPMSVHVPRVS